MEEFNLWGWNSVFKVWSMLLESWRPLWSCVRSSPFSCCWEASVNLQHRSQAAHNAPQVSIFLWQQPLCALLPEALMGENMRKQSTWGCSWWTRDSVHSWCSGCLSFYCSYKVDVKKCLSKVENNGDGGWLIFIVNLAGSRITMVTHLWACLWGTFLIRLIGWEDLLWIWTSASS